MRIAIEINGVLRNTLDKIQQTYQKYMIDKTEGIEEEDSIVREIKLPIDSLELRNHFTFINDEELYSFLYEDFPMEIFGHSQSTEYQTFNDLNDVYINPVSTIYFSDLIRESILCNFQGLYNLSSNLCLSKSDFIKMSCFIFLFLFHPFTKKYFYIYEIKIQIYKEFKIAEAAPPKVI
jgi:hypothetical protein